ncbi:MAG: ATP-binding domain-containing protein [Deltaproteobacteria bacterium]|nr:ATP-binding domain-containing protein [Deltaproteobacteria bacterium]
MTETLEPAERRIVDDEIEMAARVGRRIAKSLAERSAARGEEQRVRHDLDLIALRDEIGEARAEDVPALLAAMMRAAGVAKVEGPRAVGLVDAGVPYFGHLRLEEGARTRDVLIGKRGMIDREAGVVIVDWRDAPVSRLYYRYDEGDEYEEELGDRVIEGRVLARRTVTFEDGRLVRVRCPAGTFVRTQSDEQPWRRLTSTRATPELKGGVGKAERAPKDGTRPSRARRTALGLGDAHLRADKHLPEITALIDAKQFDAMTAKDSGVVVLQGGAGSGKTTIALHRVAWLCFEHPQRFRPEHVAVVVAQPQLARYVERLLPALDVEGVRVQSWHGWAHAAVERTLGRGARRSTRRSGARMLDRRLLAEAAPEVARLKKHPVMLDAARAQWRRSLDRLAEGVRTDVAGRAGAESALAALAADALRTLSDVADAGARLKRTAGDASVAAARVLERFLEAERDVVAAWEELITDRDLLAGALLGPHALEPEAFASALRATARQIEEPNDLDVDDERRTPIDAGEDDDDPIDAFDPCDAALLLAIAIERHGGLPVSYHHVVVDEAQDLAAVELWPLLVASRDARGQASMTLAGDVVQRVVFDNGWDDWASVEEQLGIQAHAVEPFKLAYRSTEEVVRFSRDVLGPLAPAQAPRAVRAGAPVELFVFSDVGEEIAFLAAELRSLMAREPVASVALLCRYPERARFYASMLMRAEVPRLRLVLGAGEGGAAPDASGDDFSFSPGIDVSHVARAKGLEYDYVILAEVTDAMYPDQLAARHLLHIGATRAAHQLWLTSSRDGPSPLLPRALVDEAMAAS